jgi:protein-tyrosine-phosphatase
VKRRSLVVATTVLLAGAAAFVMTADPITGTRAPAQVVFVCKNGVSMSVWSAAYFNRLAAARNLRERAIARALIPSYTAVPFNMTVALALDGFRLAGYRPHVISSDEARSADLVVAIETELPAGLRPRESASEFWDGFPPMREEYFASRKVLKARVETLVARLAQSARGDTERAAN